ncbi:MAG: hypothetical protein U9Q76_00490 [candidate division WOR-3 bacterium]|nr:hypothetical protein [candidate division WOR-3 bacterium]
MMKRTPLILAVLLILTALLPGCRERIVYTGLGDWLLLAEDPDDGNVAYNAHYLYVDADFSDGALEFKVQTYGSIPDATRDVQFAVYFDTDQDVTTGLSTSTPGWGAEAVPNDIGADYMVFVGIDTTISGRQNENYVFGWDTTGQGGWSIEAEPVSLPYQPTNEDSVKGGVSLAALGNPSQIDVVAIILCDPYNFTDRYFDHIPDVGRGHATIDLESGSIVQTSSQSAGVAVDEGSGRRVSLITGKELIEEAR